MMFTHILKNRVGRAGLIQRERDKDRDRDGDKRYLRTEN